MSPSPEVNVIATENAPLVQVVELGEARPLPERLIVNPDWQIPVIVNPVCPAVPASGLCIERAERIKVRDTEPVFPAASV